MKLEQVPTPAYVVDLAKLGFTCSEGIFPLQNLSHD